MGRPASAAAPVLTKIFQRDAPSKALSKATSSPDAVKHETKTISKTQAGKTSADKLPETDPSTRLHEKRERLGADDAKSTTNVREGSALVRDDHSIRHKKSVVATKSHVASTSGTSSTVAAISRPLSKPDIAERAKAVKSKPATSVSNARSSKASTTSKKPPASKLDAASMKALVTLRMRATAAFVRFLRKSGHDSGNVQTLLSQFYEAHPGFKRSNLNKDRLQRYSKGLVTISPTNVVTINPLDSVPTGTFSVRDARDVDFTFTFVFWLRFCDFFAFKYSKSGCSFVTATKAFCAQFGVEWQGSPMLKPMLTFYCDRVLHIDGETAAQTKLRLRRDAATELNRSVSLLFLVWLLKQFPAESTVPWIETCNRFRRKYDLQRHKMSHYDLLGFPWMVQHNVTMDKSKAVWKLQWTQPRRRVTLLDLYAHHMHLAAETSVPLLEDMSMLFAQDLSDENQTPSTSIATTAAPSTHGVDEPTDAAVSEAPTAPQAAKKRPPAASSYKPDTAKRLKVDPFDAKSELFQRHSYLKLVDQVHEI